MTSWEASDPEPVAGVWNTDHVPLKTVEHQAGEMVGTDEDAGVC